MVVTRGGANTIFRTLGHGETPSHVPLGRVKQVEETRLKMLPILLRKEATQKNFKALWLRRKLKSQQSQGSIPSWHESFDWIEKSLADFTDLLLRIRNINVKDKKKNQTRSKNCADSRSKPGAWRRRLREEAASLKEKESCRRKPALKKRRGKEISKVVKMREASESKRTIRRKYLKRMTGKESQEREKRRRKRKNQKVAKPKNCACSYLASCSILVPDMQCSFFQSIYWRHQKISRS